MVQPAVQQERIYKFPQWINTRQDIQQEHRQSQLQLYAQHNQHNQMAQQKDRNTNVAVNGRLTPLKYKQNPIFKLGKQFTAEEKNLPYPWKFLQSEIADN